jgi:hypothetical protein
LSGVVRFAVQTLLCNKMELGVRIFTAIIAKDPNLPKDYYVSCNENANAIAYILGIISNY